MRAQVTDRGLKHDRRWMLVDENDTFISQREVAKMALLQVAITDDGLLVTHKVEGSFIRIPFEPATTNTIMVEVWSDRCRAVQVSEEADAWFTKVLSMPCKLVYMPDATKRRVDGRYAIDKDITSFSDGYPMLIIGESSLTDLNGRLEQPVSISRFRPNLVFTGGAPFDEDNWDEFTIQDIHFYGVKLCARCMVTTIDPNTAVIGKEPLRTLSAYRKKNNKIYFGQNLLHKGEGTIQVGDEISLIKKRDKERRFNSTD